MRRQKSWPASGRTLSNTLRRFAPNLRAVGVDVTFDERKHGGKRIIRIEQHANTEQRAIHRHHRHHRHPPRQISGNSGDDETGGDACASSPGRSIVTAEERQNPRIGGKFRPAVTMVTMVTMKSPPIRCVGQSGRQRGGNPVSAAALLTELE